MTAIESAILRLDEKLKGVPFDFAFLGGSVLTLLITDKTADAIRVTKDVDVMMNIRTRREYHAADKELELRGFKHDTRQDAPICRWICEGVTVDVLPIREEVLGWNSRWFEQALAEAETITIEGRRIKTITAPYFIALKLEAFEDRGNGDFITSTDFEDVICLFNGRKSIADEILANQRLCAELSGKFRKYLESPELEDAVDGFVQTENSPEVRKRRIFDLFKKIAAG